MMTKQERTKVKLTLHDEAKGYMVTEYVYDHEVDDIRAKVDGLFAGQNGGAEPTPVRRGRKPKDAVKEEAAA
jgi:hypothetical protein